MSQGTAQRKCQELFGKRLHKQCLTIHQRIAQIVWPGERFAADKHPGGIDRPPCPPVLLLPLPDDIKVFERESKRINYAMTLVAGGVSPVHLQALANSSGQG